jgi:hypothetical protein
LKVKEKARLGALELARLQKREREMAEQVMRLEQEQVDVPEYNDDDREELPSFEENSDLKNEQGQSYISCFTRGFPSFCFVP